MHRMNSSSKPNIQKDEDSQISEISLSQFADDVGFNRNNNDIIDVNNQPTSPSFTQQPQNVQDPPPIQVESPSFDYSQYSQYDRELEEIGNKLENNLTEMNVQPSELDKAKNIDVEQIAVVKHDFVKNIMIDSKVSDDEIAQRLDCISRQIDKVTLTNDTKDSFYRFMIYVEKWYKDTLPNDTSITITDHILDKNDPDKSNEYNKFISAVSKLAGPSPSNSNASCKVKGMVNLNVIPVGNVSNTSESKLFYCIFENGLDLSLKKMDFISYSISRVVLHDGGKTRYTIRKYTDRPYLRASLKSLYNHEFDSEAIDFALFVLENVSNIILVNGKYVRILNDAVIFDFRSFLRNVIYWYQNHGYVISSSTLIEHSSDSRMYNQNQKIPDIGLVTQMGNVNDSNTIAYVFWLYEMRYINVYYNDFNWTKGVFIKTNENSNKDELCNYYVYCDCDRRNIYNIDSKFSFKDIPGLKYSENQEYTPSGDLKVYYDSLQEQDRIFLDKYIKAFVATTTNDTCDLYYIYPYICYCMTNDIGCLDIILKDDGKKRGLTNDPANKILAVFNKLPSIPPPIKRDKSTTIGKPRTIVRDNSSVINPKAREEREKKLREKRLKEKQKREEIKKNKLNAEKSTKMTMDNSSSNTNAREEREKKLREKRLKDKQRREEIKKKAELEKMINERKIDFPENQVDSTEDFNARISNFAEMFYKLAAQVFMKCTWVPKARYALQSFNELNMEYDKKVQFFKIEGGSERLLNEFESLYNKLVKLANELPDWSEK